MDKAQAMAMQTKFHAERQAKKLPYGFIGSLSLQDLFSFFLIVSADFLPEESDEKEMERFERAFQEWIPIVTSSKE